MSSSYSCITITTTVGDACLAGHTGPQQYHTDCLMDAAEFQADLVGKTALHTIYEIYLDSFEVRGLAGESGGLPCSTVSNDDVSPSVSLVRKRRMDAIATT